MSVTDLGLFMLRLAVGLTFAAHGAQKAFGWWNGPGPDRWRGAVAAMGFTPPGLFGVVSTGVELVGGIVLALGLLTPVAAAVLVAQAVVIVVVAHWPKGFFNSAGGFEYPLLLGIVAAVLCLLGPGAISLDDALGFHVDPQTRIACLAVGLVVGALTAAAPRFLRERALRAGLRRT